MNKKELKLDLTLLKLYFEKLEEYSNKAEKSLESKGENANELYHNYMLDIASVVGVLAGISQEASLLINDCTKIAQYGQPAFLNYSNKSADSKNTDTTKAFTEMLSYFNKKPSSDN
jgi:hypothetical protein